MLRWFDSEAENAGDIADAAYAIAAACEIYVSRRKELAILAYNHEGILVGAVWLVIGQQYFDFDVCVHPDHRNARHGLDLIEAAIAHFNELRSCGDVNLVMSVYVVNAKLAQVLAKKYRFVSSIRQPDGEYMSYYGTESSELFCGAGK